MNIRYLAACALLILTQTACEEPTPEERILEWSNAVAAQDYALARDLSTPETAGGIYLKVLEQERDQIDSDAAMPTLLLQNLACAAGKDTTRCTYRNRYDELAQIWTIKMDGEWRVHLPEIAPIQQGSPEQPDEDEFIDDYPEERWRGR